MKATVKKTATATKTVAKKPEVKPPVKNALGKDTQPRVLVERKELQSLQAERRTLFSRIDDANNEAKETRDLLKQREDDLNVARVAAVQQQEVWARHDALRCEERDTARSQCEAAEERLRLASEARSAAEIERTRLREQLAVCEAEAKRAQLEASKATTALEASRHELRRAEEASQSSMRDVREELGRERERAAAAEARIRELEPEKELAQREVATLTERLSGAVGEVKALEAALSQSDERNKMLMVERDAARARAEAAEQRGEKFNRQRAIAQEEAASHIARISALEAAASAATEATRVGQERLRTETSALSTHIECAEERCREAERRRDLIARQLESEREERTRMVSALHRADEKIMEEQVRASVAEERWQPLIRQRDDAQRERQRAARALSALHAEKRELEWAVSDLGRGGQSAKGGGVPSVASVGGGTGPGAAPTSSISGMATRAWEPIHGISGSASVLGTPAVTPAHPSSFRSSPYGAAKPHQAPTETPADITDTAPISNNPTPTGSGYGGVDAMRGLADEFRARMAARMELERERQKQAWARQQAGLVPPASEPAKAGEGDPWAALAEAHSELDKRLEAERAAANAGDPSSTPWSFV